MKNLIESLLAMSEEGRLKAISKETPKGLADTYCAIHAHYEWHRPIKTTVRVAGGWYFPSNEGRESYGRRRADFEAETLSCLRMIERGIAIRKAAAKEAEEAAYWEARGITTGVKWTPAEYA